MFPAVLLLVLILLLILFLLLILLLILLFFLPSVLVEVQGWPPLSVRDYSLTCPSPYATYL